VLREGGVDGFKECIPIYMHGSRMRATYIMSCTQIYIHPPKHTTHKQTQQAGQTKFKTAAVEYIRALGLKPTVIASSNHLGPSLFSYHVVNVCVCVDVHRSTLPTYTVPGLLSDQGIHHSSTQGTTTC
jgi:hypothetical protein